MHNVNVSSSYISGSMQHRTCPSVTAYRPPPAQWLLEAARLAAVRSYGVLGREDFESLDQLAGYVGSLFDQSMAAVSFVDEHRVWFGGGLGLAGREVARHDSFCDEAIRRPGPLVVPDALVGPRVATPAPLPAPDAELARLTPRALQLLAPKTSPPA